MPIPTPFFPRTSELCTSMRWKDWAGYYAVSSFDSGHDREYFAFRHAAGLLDVTPLYKYEVTGKDAGLFLARVMSKDVRKLDQGQVTYLCWCDEAGQVVDDGTVSRLDENHYRVTAAEPSLAWFHKFTRGCEVQIKDSTAELAAVSLQGPTSRDILAQCSDADMSALGFFRFVRAKIDAPGGAIGCWISRTGYTGDLGYEVWVDNGDALALWDGLMHTGADYGIEPAALDALDVTRIEAGFIMNGVDYFSANHCLIERRKNSPYEIGLGWTVHLKRDDFVGRAALAAEKERGPSRRLVCLEVDWDEFEHVHDSYGLPPEICTSAWRDGRPVYDAEGRWIGMATSGAWSPTLKSNLALAQIESSHAALGTRLKIEVTVEYERHKVTATVVRKPAFDPPRKRS